MYSDWKLWTLSVLAVLCLVVTALNASMLLENRAARQAVAERQLFLNESAGLAKFSNNFIRALANLAAQTNDENIRQLLAENGVTFKVNAPVNVNTAANANTVAGKGDSTGGGTQ